jgi:soluble lytic murein transglycosylase
MAYGLKRLIWRDPNLAIKTFDKTQNKIDYSEVQKEQITNAFAVSLSMKNHKKANKWLAKVKNSSLTSDLVQWLMTSALKQSNWPLVCSIYKDLPNEMQRNVQWQYWYARALIAMGDEEQGALKLKEVAQKRHYYGFLAATHSNIPVTLQNTPLEIKQSEKKPLLNYPSAQRAFEFYALGRYAKARREWRYWLSQLNDRQKLIAAKVANENGWVDRAIFTLAKVGYLDDVNLRFPKAFDKKITQYASKRKINPAWAFAIARRESSFMPDARSSAGAKGLMQIMPATAKELKGSPVDTWYLYNAENNIELGTKYLRELLDKNKGNQVLATASYNAGPHRIRKWLKYGKNMPADVWIETIPFKETRNYVKSVLAYQEIYQHKPGQVSEVFKQLIDMQIGN